MAPCGAGQGLQVPLFFRIVLSSVPHERAGAGSGPASTAQQSCLALGVATLGSLFLALSPAIGMRNALLTGLALQAAGLVLLAVAFPLRPQLALEDGNSPPVRAADRELTTASRRPAGPTTQTKETT